MDRCRSNPKDSSSNSSAARDVIHREQSYLIHIKEKEIAGLVSENKELRLQLRESKELGFTESFLSDAFNVKEEIITSNKEEYERTISNLKSHIFELQNKVDSAKYSSEG